MTPRPRKLLDRYFAFLDRRGISDVIIFHIALAVFVVSGTYALVAFNNSYITTVPTPGGTLVEGIVGTPRFVNPVLAITRADHDMATLIYSGLLKIDEHGELVNDVAESISLSEDGRTYNVKIRPGIRFHNGTELTARDFAFTIALIQNPDLKSPLQGNWDGVIIEELGERELNIVLEEPYAPFIENLTVGILPREIWDELPTEQLPFSQHNTEPIGSGPYRIADVQRNASGLINAYKLEAFTDASNRPNITTIVFNFYQNEEALMEAIEENEIAGSPSLTIEQLEAVNHDDYNIIESALPRTFAIYFNQNKSAALRDSAVREALEKSIDKDALINSVLKGYGIPIDTPVPDSFITLESTGTSTATSTEELRPETILVDGGWQKNDDGKWTKEIDEDTVTLQVTITTSNTPLFEKTAEFIAESWRAIGIEVQVDQFEQADLVQGIIRPRDFQALLFGADLGRNVDLYPFWHSSQKDDPGLNIAQYTNISADDLLTELRQTTDTARRAEVTSELITIIDEDQPAIFLFVPTFAYVIDKDVAVVPFAKLGKPSERFTNVADWHITSSNLWPIFSNQ